MVTAVCQSVTGLSSVCLKGDRRCGQVSSLIGQKTSYGREDVRTLQDTLYQHGASSKCVLAKCQSGHRSADLMFRCPCSSVPQCGRTSCLCPSVPAGHVCRLSGSRLGCWGVHVDSQRFLSWFRCLGVCASLVIETQRYHSSLPPTTPTVLFSDL